MDDQLTNPNDARAAVSRACPLCSEDIEEFRAIVKDETGVDMSESGAWNRAIELIALFRMLLGRLPEDSEH